MASTVPAPRPAAYPGEPLLTQACGDPGASGSAVTAGMVAARDAPRPRDRVSMIVDRYLADNEVRVHDPSSAAREAGELQLVRRTRRTGP